MHTTHIHARTHAYTHTHTHTLTHTRARARAHAHTQSCKQWLPLLRSTALIRDCQALRTVTTMACQFSRISNTSESDPFDTTPGSRACSERGTDHGLSVCSMDIYRQVHGLFRECPTGCLHAYSSSTEHNQFFPCFAGVQSTATAKSGPATM